MRAFFCRAERGKRRRSPRLPEGRTTPQRTGGRGHTRPLAGAARGPRRPRPDRRRHAARRRRDLGHGRARPENADAPHPGQAAARRPKTPSPQDMIPRPHRLQRHDFLKCRDLEWAMSTGHRTARAANPQPEQQSIQNPTYVPHADRPTDETNHHDTADETRLEQPRAPLTTDDEYGPASRPESSPPRHDTTASPDPGGLRSQAPGAREPHDTTRKTRSRNSGPPSFRPPEIHKSQQTQALTANLNIPGGLKPRSMNNPERPRPGSLALRPRRGPSKRLLPGPDPGRSGSIFPSGKAPPAGNAGGNSAVAPYILGLAPRERTPLPARSRPSRPARSGWGMRRSRAAPTRSYSAVTGPLERTLRARRTSSRI